MAPTILVADHKADRKQIVDMIYKKRRILFSRKTDMQAKTWAWEEIAKEAQKAGAFPVERDFIYLRDTRWQNWRKRVIGRYKRNVLNGKKTQGFDESDHMIFEIIHEYSSHLLEKAEKSLNFYESDDTAMDEDSVVHCGEMVDFEDPINVDNIKSDAGEFESTESDHEEHDDTVVTPKTTVHKYENNKDENVASDRCNGQMIFRASKDQKMDLQKMEMAEMQNYKMKLELLKMERELFLKPSKYTKDIVARQSFH